MAVIEGPMYQARYVIVGEGTNRLEEPGPTAADCAGGIPGFTTPGKRTGVVESALAAELARTVPRAAVTKVVSSVEYLRSTGVILRSGGAVLERTELRW
jgi:hypothetical protein